jgi:predicted aminopeptidase
MVDSAADNAAFVGYLQGLAAELEALYGEDISREEKLERKAGIIRAGQERFDAEYETRFRSENYRGFSQIPVNNAFLDLYRLYYDGTRFYEELYEKSGSDLPAFIAAAETVTARGDPKAQLETALLGGR